MTYTKEQRQENLAKARAEKAANPPETMPVEEIPEIVEPLSSADEKILASLTSVLDQLGSGENAERTALVTNKIIGGLHEMSLAARIELTNHPLIREALDAQAKTVAANTDLPPGTIIPGGPGWEEGKDPKKYPWTKVPWTRKKQIEIYGLCEYEPPYSQEIIVNNIHWYLVGQEINRVPTIVRDVFRQSLADKRRASAEFQTQLDSGALGGFPGTFRPGIGWNPDEPGFEKLGA